MSGGVAPTADGICLPPRESESERKALHDDTKCLSSHRRFLSFRQLNALAVAIVLAASGMVAPEDVAFAAFSLAYIYILASTAFPSRHQHHHLPGHRILAAMGALLGLALPVAYILEAVFEGDKEGIRAAAPHVFLLASQVFAEGVTSTPRFSLPMRAFVPVFYNAKRLVTLADWVRSELAKAGSEATTTRRQVVGRGLAVANFLFWAFNLFGFLLPVELPRAIERYYAPPTSTKAKL